MLQAYMDDSGSHDGSPLCVIAGYWGGVGQWRKFERAWKEVLDAYKVPEFHAKVYWGRDANKERLGPYKGWSDKKRKQFLLHLLHVIGSFKIYPFASGVLASEWNKQPRDWKRALNGASRKFPNASTHPMYMPLRTCIVRSTRYCHSGVTMNFVLDSNRNRDGWATICFAGLRQWAAEEKFPWAGSFGELTFGDSARAMPLQAADLLAYEAFKYAQFAKGDKSAKVRDVYMMALKNFKSKDDFWLFDAPRFEHIAKAAEKI